MAQIWSRPEIKLKIALELNEEEARALQLLCEYDHEHFLKLLYQHIGEEPIDKNKKGILSLLETSKQPLSFWLCKIDQARKIFEEKL